MAQEELYRHGAIAAIAAIAPRALSLHIETAPTSIDVLLHPTLGQSDEPSDLRGSLSHTTSLHTCPSVYMS